MEVLSSLFTILVIVTLGILSRQFGIFKAEHAKTLSSFVYYFGLPALFFIKISNLDLLSLDTQLVLGATLPTVIVLALLLISKWLRLIQKDAYVLLSLSISFGSYAFFGIAFFETFQDGRWLDHSIIAASILGIVGIITTLILLEYANAQKISGGFLRKIFSNPLILSIILGSVFSLAGIQLSFLSYALTLVGQTASAIAIFVLGMFIIDRFSLENIKQALPFSLFRLLALPAISLILALYILPGSNELNQFLLLMNGMPAAIALVVFAERYDYKITEIAGIVSLTSIFSFIGLTLIFYIAQMVF
jgi:predicted permease